MTLKAFARKAGRLIMLCLLGVLGVLMIGGGVFVCTVAAFVSIALFYRGSIDPASNAALISLAGGFSVALGRALTGRVFGLE